MRPLLIGMLMFLAACAPSSGAVDPETPGATEPAASTTVDDTTTTTISAATTTSAPRSDLGPPTWPDGPLDEFAVGDLERLWASFSTGIDVDAIEALGFYDDPRLAWPIADLMRFVIERASIDALRMSFEGLTGTPLTSTNPWTEAVNLLLAWDVPAPPGYLGYKAELFTTIDPRWEPFFSEPTALDYRLIGWGGVLIDDRPLGNGDICPQGCIPALDDPAVTAAEGGDWLEEDFPVFGVVVNGEARAYPKNMMEVHEMVNDTLGGRRIAFPYCTLCGSAQVYFTDTLDEPVVMRTSGLLSRSNKVMFDLNTMSAFDTFTGEAVTGPLYEQRVVLEEATVVTSTWGEWRSAHPETTIIAQDGGIGRTYLEDPLGGRDDAGPIFPIGERDPRLPVHEQVLGVILDDGTPVAFPVAAAKVVTETSGATVELAGVTLQPDAGGFRAVLADGAEVAAHQAFWFAWSQFHPETLLWQPDG